MGDIKGKFFRWKAFLLLKISSVPSESDIISSRHFLCRALLQRDFVYASKANITKLGKIICLEDSLSAYICFSSFCEEGVKAFSGRTMKCQPCDLLYIYVFIYIYTKWNSCETMYLN